MVTPHIDRLAEQGVMFTRAYCQVPVCGATRASLLTGTRPARGRFTSYDTWVDRDRPGAITIPQHFRDHGYLTVSVGKVFHHQPDTADRSWTDPPWRPAAPAGQSWRNYILPENQATDVDNKRRGPPVECADVADNAYYDGQIADRACAELNRLTADGRPFFLAAGFLKPHLPFNAPKRYWDRYRHDHVPLADNPFPPIDAPRQAVHNWGELRAYAGIPAEGPVSEDMARWLVHGYYAATSYTDSQVGRLLAELDRLGLADTTAVVLWGDHGWQLGEHGLWCKHCCFNTSLNAPLVLRVPWVGGGHVSDALAEFVDVFPTLCDVAGIPQPESLDGASLAPILASRSAAGKPAVFSRYGAGDSVRTDRYLYTEWTDDAGRTVARMLYDHATDPAENANLAARPEHRETVTSLRTLLHDAIRRRGDPIDDTAPDR
jgi:arylsulfatase A-like enzyme